MNIYKVYSNRHKADYDFDSAIYANQANIAKVTKVDKTIHLKNGAKIKFVTIDDDASKIGGVEMDYLEILDTQPVFTQEIVDLLRSRVR